MNVKKIISLLMLFMGIVVIESCTDLDEEILDETSATGLSERETADGMLAPAYGVFSQLFTHTHYFNLQEISTDEAILPYRGGTDWGDNGIFIAMHTHNFATTDPRIGGVWNNIFQGISRCVTALNVLPTLNTPEVNTYIAEVRALRAYYSMLTLDLFGLVLVKDEVGETSTILRGAEALEYIESELLAVESEVSPSVGPGRISTAAVKGLLARLYLNAAVYRDRFAASFNFREEDMDKVIAYCDEIINSGQFQLSPEYFALFDDENHDNPELIFVYEQRAELNGHNRMAYFSLSGDQYPLPEFPGANGTDGPGITSDFYRTWVNAYAPVDPADIDPRFYKENLSIYSNPADSCVAGEDFHINRGILRGEQFGLIRENGVFVRCEDGVNFKVGKIYNESRNNPNLPVNFTEQIDFSVSGSGYSTGYRVEKYEFSRKSVSGRNFGEADISLLRLADVYLMRAEAKLRKNSDAAGALADVNIVRASRTARTPPPPLTEMSLDLLYRERGFEFYWEMLRRTDMIRFGKYEDSWTEKTNSDPLKRVFPIPQNAVDGASNIPGYLEQNEGY
ncbi:RagB/SusD family nutrient uptake outer membrane protein [Catalinimonas niigatensis]|uniref:RagB/SusD family nutrient uptake outer membrane protein n=1 Tax=Catalinimonas niigatensis TaxID=1397264 RepID=UPI002665473B|nr:RagB/SusD family nutrient uptake outer membrane protein [Catalinimonas niigatensis]WPP51455.1 RagB/SusD family nutrient uptake outer membrane protein [Catalinimonas niigatensis]